MADSPNAPRNIDLTVDHELSSFWISIPIPSTITIDHKPIRTLVT